MWGQVCTILAFSSLPLFPEGEMWRNAGLYVHAPQIFANVENFGAMTSNGFAGKIWSGGEKIAPRSSCGEICGEIGVLGKRGPLRRRKVNGVWTEGRYKKRFEVGEPI